MLVSELRELLEQAKDNDEVFIIYPTPNGENDKEALIPVDVELSGGTVVVSAQITAPSSTVSKTSLANSSGLLLPVRQGRRNHVYSLR